MRRLALSAALVALSVAQPAFAQYDPYANRSTVITSPALGGGTSYPRQESANPATTPLPMTPSMANRLDERVDQLEEMVRQLTGKVEEANYRAQQALKQMERMQADIDLRFRDLQTGQSAAAQPPQAPSAPAGAERQPQSLSMPTPNRSADGPGLAPGPQSLGTLSDRDLKKPAAAAPAAAPKDPQSAYDAAYGALQSGDYANAESGFQDFLAKYPSHQLAGNAQYWLGETAFVRKDFNTAAATFLEGYKKFPNHSKAADMIYKAASSFGQMGKSREACTAFAILFKEQAGMPDRVKRAATSEKQKLGCK